MAITEVHPRAGLTIYVEDTADRRLIGPTRVTVYDHVNGSARAATFNSNLAIAGDGIQPASGPTDEGRSVGDLLNVVDRLIFDDKLGEALKPAPPPQPLWSTIPLVSNPLPNAAQEYLEDLRSCMSSGGAELLFLSPKEKSDFERCRLLQPVHYGGDAFLVELFRHPFFSDFISGSSSWETDVKGTGWESDLTNNSVYNGRIIAGANVTGINPFSLAGELAQILFSGGCYCSRHDHRRVKELADRCREALWGENYESVYSWRIAEGWGSWFKGIVDGTLVSFDLENQTITCLVYTDTD